MFRRGLLTLVALVLAQQISADLGHGNFRSRSLEEDKAGQRFNDFNEEHADVESESDSWSPLNRALKFFKDFAGGDNIYAEDEDRIDAEEDEDLNLSSTGTFQDFEESELPGPEARKLLLSRRLQKKAKAPAQMKAKKIKQNKPKKVKIPK